MNAIIDNVMYHLPANLQGFYLKSVSEKEYVLLGLVDGVAYGLDKDCGLEHEYPVYFDLDNPCAGTLRFDELGGAVFSPRLGNEEMVWMNRNEDTGECRMVLERDLSSEADLREMIDSASTMEDWEKRHFLEWLVRQDGVGVLGKYNVLDNECLTSWEEAYYGRDVTMLTDFVLENLVGQELDLHLQAPHPEAFKEFATDHSLVPVERQSKFVAIKGDTVVVFNGKTWKIIYVF